MVRLDEVVDEEGATRQKRGFQGGRQAQHHHETSIESSSFNCSLAEVFESNTKKEKKAAAMINYTQKSSTINELSI